MASPTTWLIVFSEVVFRASAVESGPRVVGLTVDSCAMQLSVLTGTSQSTPIRSPELGAPETSGAKFADELEPVGHAPGTITRDANRRAAGADRWAAGVWSSCMSCPQPVKYRSVTCRSISTGEVLQESACSDHQKPISYKSCSCELEVCEEENGICGEPEDPVTLGMPSYSEAGCFELSDGDPGPTCIGDFDTTCLEWNETKPCKSGFPFFSICSSSDASSCFDRCITRGLDMFAIVNGLECRCGASLLNEAVWRLLSPPDGKIFSGDAATEAAGGECALQVFQYNGIYDSGYVPLVYVTSANVGVEAYVDSIVTGTVVTPEKEEGPAYGGNVVNKTRRDFLKRLEGSSRNRSESLISLSQRSSSRRLACNTPLGLGDPWPVDCDDAWWTMEFTCDSLIGDYGLDCSGCACPGDMPAARSPPTWTRNCYPSQCGYGNGPWPTRQTTAPHGVPDLWDDYVIVPYKFQSGLPAASKAVFEDAAKHWYDQTCVVFQETTSDNYMKVDVVNTDADGCFTNFMGRPSSDDQVSSLVNMGWCNSAARTGNVIHELGHILGMVHEQQRPDAQTSYHGHGPYLVIHWENIDADWVSQYTPFANAYLGSAHDGDGDAYAGYSAYDFSSIMHYAARSPSKFTTIPESVTANVGQRVGISSLDITQILDQYQCKANDASRLAKGLKVAGPFCTAQGALATNYVLGGETLDKKPWYVSADGGYYLYYDPDCDGQGSTAKWIFDKQQPSENATSDLDGDSACDYEAESITATSLEIWRGIPLGRSTFRLHCASQGWQNEEVTITGLEPLHVSGHCQSGVDGYYTRLGYTSSGRPWYANGQGHYLYFDPDCSPGVSPTWHFDTVAPCGRIGDVGYIAEGDAAEVPRGTNTWQSWCQGDGGDWAWAANDVTVEDSLLPPTPPPTPHPECTDTDAGQTDSAGYSCANGYSHHFRSFCGSFDDADFSSNDMCCVCGGGLYPTSSPTPSPTREPTASPTSAPTPSPPRTTAVGDPHLTSLVGASFDVNKPGEYALLRVPFDEALAAQLEVRAVMKPTSVSPCGLWITEVIFRGDWVGEEIRVRTSGRGGGTGRHREPAGAAAPAFALLQGNASASQKWRPWSTFDKNVDVAMSGHVAVRPTFRLFQGAAATKGRRIFEFLVGSSADPEQRVSVSVAQASNPALDVQVTRLGRLGAHRFGGLLGTEEHDPRIEEPSLRCAAHLKGMGAITQRDWQRIIASVTGNSAAAGLLSVAGERFEQAANVTASW